MERKYELTKETKTYFDQTVYRIKSLRTFIDKGGNIVNAGDLGGFVRSELNLSHEGRCWVRDDAVVTDYAVVDKNALLMKNCFVYGTANISDNSAITDSSIIGGEVKISGDNIIRGDCRIDGSAQIKDSYLNGSIFISDFAEISNSTIIDGIIVIENNANIENSSIRGLAHIRGDAKVYDVNLEPSNINLSYNADIKNSNDFLVIGPIGSRFDYTTFYITKDNSIWVCCGCFTGSIEDFAKRVRFTHRNNYHAKEYFSAIELAKKKLDRGE